METIASKYVGKVGGFDISARLVPDEETRTDDFDCYTSADRQAWIDGSWQFVGIIITASKAGIVLGEASMWANEYGDLGYDDDGNAPSANPLDGDGDEFVNGYGPQMIAEAIAQAKAKLAELQA